MPGFSSECEPVGCCGTGSGADSELAPGQPQCGCDIVTGLSPLCDMTDAKHPEARATHQTIDCTTGLSAPLLWYSADNRPDR